MSEAIQAALITSSYRIITMLIGCVIVYLGYRLFFAGMFQNAADLKAAWGEKNLTLKQASPGIFFALFGASLIAISIWRGVNIEITRNSNNQQHQGELSSSDSKQLETPSPNATSSPVQKGTLDQKASSEKLQKNKSDVQVKENKTASGEVNSINIGFYGGQGNKTNELLSIQFRRLLSDQASCLMEAVNESLREGCREKLLKKVKVIPTTLDVEAIEKLERDYAKNRDPKIIESLMNMKLHFLR